MKSSVGFEISVYTSQGDCLVTGYYDVHLDWKYRVSEIMNTEVETVKDSDGLNVKEFMDLSDWLSIYKAADAYLDHFNPMDEVEKRINEAEVAG